MPVVSGSGSVAVEVAVTGAGTVTGTVAGAVRDAGPGLVLVTTLVDGVLDRHRRDYARTWPRRDPAWPEDGPRQPAQDWLAEARSLLRSEGLVFGRVAVVAWCLLDDDVAEESVASGLLGALAAEVSPSLADHLSAGGRDLLRRRAPLIALQEGLLPVSVEGPLDPEDPVRHLALRGPSSTDRGVGRWAMGFPARVSVGRGTESERVYPPSPPGDTDPPVHVDVSALGWSRRGTLWVILADGPDGGVVRWDAAQEAVLPLGKSWPHGTVAAVGEGGVALVPGQGEDGKILWGNVDDGAPVVLAPPGPQPVRLAASGRTVTALLPDGTVRAVDLTRVDGPWYPGGSGTAGVTAIAQQLTTSWFGTDTGSVGSFTPDGSATAPTVALPGERIEHLACGGGLVVAASGTSVAVLRDGALVCRWRSTQGGGPQVVALSPDGRSLGICADGLVRMWRVDSQPELRLTGYLADTPQGEDLLDITPTVKALAAVVCAHVVQPPLAIGLFGSWGSGKSFFMEQLHAKVEEITGTARTSGRTQSQLWAWRNVRQVRFNAWHYASADVWAGMLEQLIAGISVDGAARDVELPLPPGLSAAEEARVRRLADAEAEVRTRAEALAEAERQGAEGLFELASTSTLETLRRNLDGADLKLEKDLSTTLTEVVATREKLRQVGWLTPGTRRQLLVTSGKVGAVFAVVLGVLLLLLRWTDVRTMTWGPIAALVSAAAGAATWVREKVQQYAARVESVTAAQQLLEEAQANLEAAREQARPASVGRLLNEYLEGRVTTDDYRSQLGLIGTVHRDLRVISDGVTRHNRRLLEAPEASREEGADAVNRVVLYIDDLDRCPPKTVVRVLEAVSMLLSFELFVVVVAVDAHWVSTSLSTVYPTLLEGGEVTADNYLEKIFQLPVWLDRPGPEAATSMARHLLGQAAATGRGEGGAGPASGTRPEPDATQGSAEAATDGEGTAYPGGSASGAGEGVGAPLATSPPAPVTLLEGEATSIAALAPMLARSPRALKRYLNTYRLLKGLVDEEDLEAARLMLAVATGRPRTGERLLDQIAGAEPGVTLETLVRAWPPEDREWFTGTVPVELRTWSTWTAGSLRPAAEAVRRFVFRTAGTPAPTSRPAPIGDPDD